MTTETVKELTRSIAEATEGDAALLAEALAACQAANGYLADMAIRGGPKPGDEGILEWCRVQSRLAAVLASARRMGKEGGA